MSDPCGDPSPERRVSCIKSRHLPIAKITLSARRILGAIAVHSIVEWMPVKLVRFTQRQNSKTGAESFHFTSFFFAMFGIIL